MYRRVPQKKYLYHYTSPESFEKIMKGMSLRFNFYKNMNDPKESKYWSSSICEKDVITFVKNACMKDKPDNLNLYYSFNEDRLNSFQKMKMKIQVLSFTTDNPVDEFGTDQADAYLHRGFGNPYFWAHYGNAQKGICIQFDTKAIEKKFEKIKVDHKFSGRHIIYDNDLFEGNPAFVRFSDLLKKSIEEIVKDCIFKNQDHYLFTKTTFWQPEREYRFALYSESEELVFLDINDCVSSIILGEDIKAKDQDLTLNIGQNYGIAVAKVNWGNGYPTAVNISKYDSQYPYD